MNRILIVEDTPIIRQPMARLLRSEGYDVTCAANGVDALASLESSPVDLVLLDVLMPKMNGVELLRAVRAHGPTQKSAFFLLTGVEDKEFLQLAMSLKVNNYLKKPVSVPELKKKIEAVFGVLQ